MRASASLVAVAALVVASAGHARKPATIGSLDDGVAQITAGAPVTGTVEAAIESYRAFLQLAASRSNVTLGLVPLT